MYLFAGLLDMGITGLLDKTLANLLYMVITGLFAQSCLTSTIFDIVEVRIVSANCYITLCYLFMICS